ncbi:hypothetical protein HDU92_003631 [Lobulomyces angularis]|nr:hypothetical protein HDU92_003631 [Lobulomyces angularis]
MEQKELNVPKEKKTELNEQKINSVDIDGTLKSLGLQVKDGEKKKLESLLETAKEMYAVMVFKKINSVFDQDEDDYANEEHKFNEAMDTYSEYLTTLHSAKRKNSLARDKPIPVLNVATSTPLTVNSVIEDSIIEIPENLDSNEDLIKKSVQNDFIENTKSLSKLSSASTISSIEKDKFSRKNTGSLSSVKVKINSVQNVAIEQPKLKKVNKKFANQKKKKTIINPPKLVSSTDDHGTDFVKKKVNNNTNLSQNIKRNLKPRLNQLKSNIPFKRKPFEIANKEISEAASEKNVGVDASNIPEKKEVEVEIKPPRTPLLDVKVPAILYQNTAAFNIQSSLPSDYLSLKGHIQLNIGVSAPLDAESLYSKKDKFSLDEKRILKDKFHSKKTIGDEDMYLNVKELNNAKSAYRRQHFNRDYFHGDINKGDEVNFEEYDTLNFTKTWMNTENTGKNYFVEQKVEIPKESKTDEDLGKVSGKVPEDVITIKNEVAVKNSTNSTLATTSAVKILEKNKPEKRFTDSFRDKKIDIVNNKKKLRLSSKFLVSPTSFELLARSKLGDRDNIGFSRDLKTHFCAFDFGSKTLLPKKRNDFLLPIVQLKKFF